MAKIVVIRRELPPAINIATRFLVAAMGLIIAVVLTSYITKQSIDKVFCIAIESFADPNVFRFISVFLPIALGLSIVFNSNIWNLGAEGQIVVGAIGATYIALYTSLGRIDVVAPLASLLFASLCGALWALPAILLRNFLGVNEAVTTLLMNYIAYYFADYLVRGPWRGRSVYGYPTTDLIPDQSRIPQVPGYSFSWEIVTVSFILTALTYILLYKTRLGIAIRALGSNPRAVELSGVSSKTLSLLAFALSGALAGFVGGSEILVYHRKLVEGEIIGNGMGFTSIMVAWLGALHPLGIAIASYYTAALYRLSFALQIGSAAIGDALSKAIVGIVFISALIAEFVSRYKIVLIRR